MHILMQGQQLGNLWWTTGVNLVQFDFCTSADWNSLVSILWRSWVWNTRGRYVDFGCAHVGFHAHLAFWDRLGI